MRQGNGEEILGAHDPRGKTIGMVDVAPNDDRESVLSAILTQEKLGRKWIVVVLPAQNKALQQVSDFNLLKDMRGKLHAQVIIIAPSGSSPAEFARRRNFTVYSTVENYTKSLQDEPKFAQNAKRGWGFGKKSNIQGAENPQTSENTPSLPPPVALPIDNVTGTSVGNASRSIASEPADPALDVHQGDAMPGEEFPLIPVSNQQADMDDITQPKPLKSINEQDAMLPPPGQPSSSVFPIEKMPTQEIHANEGMESDKPQAFSPSAQSGGGSGIIEFPSGNKRKTGPMPIPMVLPGTTVEPDVPADHSHDYRDSMAVPAGAAANAGGSKVRRASFGRSGPPTRANARRTALSGSAAHRGPRLWIVSLIFLLVLSVLFCGGLALAAPSTFSSIGGIFNGSNLAHVLTGTPSAVVSLVPKSTELANTYEISAVTGTPQRSQRQVKARQLTYTTSKQNKTVNATGVKQTPATQATGSLTFYNALGTSQTVSSGTVFNVGNGIQVENTAAANIPAANPPTEGSVTVAARAVTSGSRGNIGAGTLYLASCCANGITVSNTSAFSGGQDPQNYTVVSQSDVNNAATPLGNQLLQTAQSSLKSQEQSGEVFASQPQCSTNVTSNPAVGAASKTVTVSVSGTCSGEVYDQSGTEALTTSLLNAQGNQSKGYVLTGIITTSQPQVISIDAKTGRILLLDKAQGNWVYQFSASQKTALAKDIAGKTKAQAQSLLLKQPGVAAVKSIDISGGNGNKLPTDYTQITITTASTPATPTVGPGSPTTSPIPVTPGTGTPSGPVTTPTTGLG